MLYYALFYLVGLVAGFYSPTESMQTALSVLEPITLTALVASLLVPFAGFASNERWQKFCLQYAIVPLFGIYTVVLWRTYATVGLILLVCASIVHAAYWMSSIHSRAYRLELFKMLPNKPELIVRMVALLSAEGHAEEADEMVKAMLSQNLSASFSRLPYLAEVAKRLEADSGLHDLLKQLGWEKAIR